VIVDKGTLVQRNLGLASAMGADDPTSITINGLPANEIA
jgi:hypothetical protein